MHIDPHVQSYIEKHLLAPQSICRFSDGSIGYILGDGTISTCRRARYRNCAAALSRIARLATGWRRRVEVADAVAPVVEPTPADAAGMSRPMAMPADSSARPMARAA